MLRRRYAAKRAEMVKQWERVNSEMKPPLF